MKPTTLRTKLEFLSDVLEDFCIKNSIEFLSADDILYSDIPLTEYQKDWLRLYINVWDIIEQDYTPNSKDCMETFIPTFHDWRYNDNNWYL